MDTTYSTPGNLTSTRPRQDHFWNPILKRWMDIIFSALGLTLLWPVFLIIGWRLKHEDKGPVFYRGKRVGLGGKIFEILKFRTMYERPESYTGAPVTGNHDERVTPIGHWLRNTKLNELPQLWNVLVGDMSLVGPRPEDPEIVQTFPPDYREEILSVRPGITSPTSIAYYNEEDLLARENVMGDYLNLILPDKMRMDLLYVRHHTISSDLDTIFWTFIILVPRIRRQKIQEGWLFDGPITRFVRHYFSWLVIDFLVAFSGIVLTGLIWRTFEPLDVGMAPSFLLGIILAMSFGLANTLLGLRMVSWQKASAGDALRLIFSCILVGAFYIALRISSPTIPALPADFVATSSLVVMAGFVIARYRTRLLTGLAKRWVELRKSSLGVGERVLIIGAGNAGEFAAWMLRRPDFHLFYQVIGYVDDAHVKQGMKFDGIRVLGTCADIPALVEMHNIGLLCYAINNAAPPDRERILTICTKTGRPVVFMPEVIENVRRMFAESLHSQV
jgi:lipopolysaccharide/colanic/teichoic acid biosynthesis glycosyltransferase